MGEVLQLRVPSRKLGFDDVILVPRETNTESARAVLAYPQNYSESILRAACLWLRDHGDWMDQERARHLLRVMDREKAEMAEFWVREKRTLRLVALFIVGCSIGIAVFDAAWGQLLAVSAP